VGNAKKKLSPIEFLKSMPTPVVTSDKMSIGGQAGGKHWTAAEVESRAEAAQQARRPKQVRLKPPAWMSEDALKVWKDIVRKLKGIELLDNLDSELLAIYCDAIVNYRICSTRLSAPLEPDQPRVPMDDLVKAMQAWARIVTTYADKLGLTPGGRARLAKRKAEKIVDAFADTFGG
jgi:P27 family predicted phage terminase small subunit